MIAFYHVFHLKGCRKIQRRLFLRKGLEWSFLPKASPFSSLVGETPMLAVVLLVRNQFLEPVRVVPAPLNRANVCDYGV